MLPKKFIDRIYEQLDDADEFIESFNNPYIKALRINKKKNPNDMLPGNRNSVSCTSRVAWEQRGIYYYETSDLCSDDNKEIPDYTELIDAPGKSPLHAAGAYYIQEASAMLPVTMLDIEELVTHNNSPKVLDLCAAPGGKTTQIADYMEGKGLLVCNEIIPSRAKILSENIERMGVSNALVISADPIDLKSRFPYFFDRILVDAPCSGEGMFRKHPEAMNEWSLENVDICADRQDMILDCAASMLAPGGKIVYSTCTFAPKEDEGSIERFLDRHPEFELSGKMHRLYPHKDRGEGHFSACLVRKTNLVNTPVEDASKQVRKPKKKNTKISKETIKLLNEFFDEYINKNENTSSISPEKIQDRLLVFGERIFIAPENMPSIEGLSVLRPGLCLGSVLKGRFEPDHALALALSKEDVVRSVDFEDDSIEISQYLRGQTLNIDKEKGWYLVCVDGLSIGWGKLSNGCLKNHYPKGLRIMG